MIQRFTDKENNKKSNNNINEHAEKPSITKLQRKLEPTEITET